MESRKFVVGEGYDTVISRSIILPPHPEAMSVSISAGFEKLLREPAYCQLATLMADGSPQITQVWVDTDGELTLVNTAEGRQKTKNVRRDPRVAVNVVDPDDAWRLAMVRGRVVAARRCVFVPSDAPLPRTTIIPSLATAAQS